MKRFATLALLLAAALPVAAGLTDLDNPGPSVVSVTARQRYPWNGLVDVDVSFTGNAGETYRIELSATDKTGGTNLPVRTAWLESTIGAVGNPVDVPAPGTHRLVWNAGADLPAGFVADRVTVTAKLLNPIWSFESIPEIDPDDEWAPETVYHDVQTVVSYGEIEDHEPTVRCLTDEWNLEASLGANVVFSGSSMGLRQAGHADPNNYCPISLWALSDKTNNYRMVTLDYATGRVVYDNQAVFQIPGSDVRFFQAKSGDGRQFLDICRDGGHDVFIKSANTDLGQAVLTCRYEDDEHGSAVCGYFPNGIPWSDASSTSTSSYDKGANAAVFFSGTAGTDIKEAIVLCGGSAGVRATSKYSCMANPVGRYVVPLLDGNKYFTVGYPSDRPCALQNFGLSVGLFTNHLSWNYWLGNTPGVAWSKGVAMPDGKRIFLGGAGKSRPDAYGKVRMWQDAETVNTFSDYPAGHPFESWARRDVTCLLPNGKFCGVDEELGLVVVNPLTGETYVASDDPVFKKGKMGCQLLPNGKVWIIPYDCEGREFAAGTNLCGKLYEVDFGFTRSFSLSSLCSPYLKVAEGDPEPSGIKVGLDPNGGELPGIYAQYYKGENPVYGELPVPTWAGHTFLGWSTDGTATNIVAATDAVPALGILLKAAWRTHTYTVKFNKNATDATGTMANQSFTYGVAQALTANAFARPGYTFREWGSGVGGGNTHWSDRQVVSNLTTTAGGVVNLYAIWDPNTYSVKFNANATDATGSMSNESFTYGTAKALTANSFARTGYTFGGWATSATGAKAYNDKQSVSNLTATVGVTVNLYAVWTPITYSVKFNANGGSGTMSNQSFQYGTAQALTANAFTRTGYMFAGWATSATGAKVYNDKQSVSNLASTQGATCNLYAAWEGLNVTNAEYMVIDVSGGSNARYYPVSYLAGVPTGGWTDEYKTTKLVLKHVRAGTYRQGCPKYVRPMDKYQAVHTVVLTKDFYLGIFELTQQQASLLKRYTNMDLSVYKGDTRPVDAMWNSMPSDIIATLNSKVTSGGFTPLFSLPTEAQWECACRATSTTELYDLYTGVNLTSDDQDSRLNSIARYRYTRGDGRGGYTEGTTAVGSYEPNAWGFYDMLGNVKEACRDFMFGLSPDINSTLTDPCYTENNYEGDRVLRGGGYVSIAEECTAGYRDMSGSDTSYNYHQTGFRVCLTVE